MPDVIVSLGGLSLKEGRQAARRFLERTNSATSLESVAPRRTKIPPSALKLERARMRKKVRGTTRMRSAILDAIGQMRAGVLDKASLRETTAREIVEKVELALHGMDPKTLARVISEVQAELYQDGLDSASTELGITWDAPPQAALDALYAHTLEFAQNVVDREKVAIKDALLEGLSSGESSAQIAQRIRDSFDDGMHIIDPASAKVVRIIPDDSWSEMVARTEVSRAMNAGVMATYQFAGVQTIMWVAAEDERTCPDCSDLDGDVVPINDGFDGLDGPPAHPGCRCTTVAADEAYMPDWAQAS